MAYIVTKSFNDENGTYHNTGETYTPNNEQVAAELERGGYISKDDTQSADLAAQQAQRIEQSINQVRSSNSYGYDNSHAVAPGETASGTQSVDEPKTTKKRAKKAE